MLASTMASIRVWIVPGCTRCHWYQQLVPKVFADSADGCRIRAETRADQRCDDNQQARSASELAAPLADFVEFVAGGCPAKVIHTERGTAER